MKQETQSNLMEGKTVEDAVQTLTKRGMSKSDAIDTIRRQYEVQTSFTASFLMTQISSAILILILYLNIPDLSFIKMVIGGIFVIFLAGYNLLQLLYVRSDRLFNGLEKLSLSLGLGFVSVSLIGLLLDFTVGISLYSATLSVVIFVELMSIMRYELVRRNEL
ncbi:Protein of unknown function (DUF1616) [Metallosphaera yellowstonensis MK1]|jgi:uncharacterized membrane protein|uniref:DUF1616 domain-containing protein n=1 Tax=Metallosphaera yellowstonensis MK1 TaxID=671065 RepID=H2C0G6_9CREN|nr:DUF1616 domain-containing protein [Metallosphaera yellowstonensis]EHP71228.1 Protein of unknown function (DUF1616) [Metallosphaera yellowstonensis MK1]